MVALRSSMSLFKIAAGRSTIPTNGIDGQVRDCGSSSGRIVAGPTDPAVRPTRTIDAAGLVVMPGGIDMHCHIAGPKVNMARKMRPEEKREAEPVRRTARHAQRHDGQRAQHVCHRLQVCRPGLHDRFRRGDSAAVGPACPRGVRRHALHRQGLLRPDGQQPLHHARDSATASPSARRRLSAWLLVAGQGLRAETGQSRRRRSLEEQGAGNVHGLDSTWSTHFDVTPRQIIQRRGRKRPTSCKLPHPVHIHANNLGLPGNWTTTLETMQALEGHRRAPDAHSVPQLRRRRRRREHFQLQGRAAGRVRQRNTRT